MREQLKENEVLKPCPWDSVECKEGHTPYLESFYLETGYSLRFSYQVRCYCDARGMIHHDRKDAIDSWNTRTAGT